MVVNYKFKTALLIQILLILVTFKPVYSAEDVKIGKEFSLFTSRNLEGYLKPLFTSISESFHSNHFTKALFEEKFYIGLDISVMGMYIPNSQKEYNAERPSEFGILTETAEYRNGEIIMNKRDNNYQPTIYGGHSTAIFSSPKQPGSSTYPGIPDSTYKTIAFIEGNNIEFMSGIPNIQLILGFPTRTQLRIKGWGAPIKDHPLLYLSFTANQQIDHFFNLFDPKDHMGIALMLNYQTLTLGSTVDLSGFACGVNFSKEWIEGLNTYCGLQYEDLSGSAFAKRDTANLTKEVVDSPYDEVRNGGDLKPAIGTFTNFRALIGASYRYGFLELHTDAAYCTQPALNVGLTFWFGSWNWGKGTIRQKDIEIEEIKPIKRRQKLA